MLRLDFLNQFSDEYLHKEEGKGVLLAGVVLGNLARQQLGQNQTIDQSPIFKQVNFGKMQMRDLKRHLARVPELTRAYRVVAPGRLERLAAEAGAFILASGAKNLGIDGNFAFTVGFLNSWQYYARIFDITDSEKILGQESQEPLDSEDYLRGVYSWLL